MAAILYETRLGCLEKEVPRDTQDYITALNLMFSSFKTTMYAGAIPRWLRPVLPGPWEDFCSSWDGLFNFSKESVMCVRVYHVVWFVLMGVCFVLVVCFE